MFPRPTQKPPTVPQWVTIRDAAEMTGCHERTIRRRIQEGALPAERIGPRLIRIRLADLESLGRSIGGAA